MVIWGQHAFGLKYSLLTKLTSRTGQSAGSISVDFYNFAWHNDSIVAGLIMDSGTAESPTVSTDFAHTNFTFVADHVGCSGLASDPASQLSCMKSVDAAALENFVANYQENGTTPAIAFTPIPDGQVVFSNYTERALQGLQAKIVSEFLALMPSVADEFYSQPLSAPMLKMASPSRRTIQTDPIKPLLSWSCSPSSSARLPRPFVCARRPAEKLSAIFTPETSATSHPGRGWERTIRASCPC